MWDCRGYQVHFFNAIVLHLAMSHSRIFCQEVHTFILFKMPPECTTRAKSFYVKSAWMWHFCRYKVVFYHCIFSGLPMSHCSILSQKMHTFALSKMSSRVYHAFKLFLRKNACKWDCCRYHVVFFHCFALHLTLSHCRILSQQVHICELDKMSSRVYRACKILLGEKCVDVGFLSLSCIFLLFYRLAFIYVQNYHVLSRCAYFCTL